MVENRDQFAVGGRARAAYTTKMMKFWSALTVALTSVIVAAPAADAQSAFFSYSGFPSSAITPGSSFTVNVNITFTGGGNISNLAGFSYWMWQSAGSGNPFAITNRNVTGSIFTDLQSGSLQYPQQMTPINRNPDGTTNQTDLGALFGNGQSAQGSGTYFVASLTFSVSNAFMGSYTISNTTSATPGVGGRFSVITDSDGDTFPIAASPFTISVIPEPSTIALLGAGAGLLFAGGTRSRRRARR
jgi:hypothetical protein